MTHRPAVMLAAATLVLSACAGSSGSSSSSGSATSRGSSTATAIQPDDLTRKLVLYPPGSPCAGTARSAPINDVAESCRGAWGPYGVQFVPGDEIVQEPFATRFPGFTYAKASGITRDAAETTALATWRWHALLRFTIVTHQFGILQNQGVMGPFTSKLVKAGELVQDIEAGRELSDPPCYAFPKSVAIVSPQAELAAVGGLTLDANSNDPRYGHIVGYLITDEPGCSFDLVDAQSRAVVRAIDRNVNGTTAAVGFMSADPVAPDAVLAPTAVGSCARAIEVATMCSQATVAQ